MVFDNKPISEITDEDLTDLIGNQEENLWIDFKQQYDGYKTDDTKYKREIRKDVTAMANAEGGYILIGVDESNKIAQGFFSVPEAEKQAQIIYDTCHQYIVPRIARIEVKTCNLEWRNRDLDLIIIHIPFSENRPHGFDSNGTLNFVKRYRDTTKEFQMDEFIPDLLARYQQPYMDDIRGQLDRIEHQTTDILKKIRESE